MEYTTIDNNGTLLVGKYRVTFNVLAFPETIADIITSFRNSISELVEVMEGKPIRILSAKQIGDTNKIVMEFELLKNPVPVALIVGAIVGILGIAGVLLSLDKIEKISDSPLGVGLGLYLIIGAVLLAYNIYQSKK
jgi:hypothetical protein